jgi:hypothetical protein
MKERECRFTNELVYLQRLLIQNELPMLLVRFLLVPEDIKIETKKKSSRIRQTF